MTDILNNLLNNSEIPIITAFLLGLLTAISPCPLATNITAVGFISKDIGSGHRVFLNGVLYTVGRMLAYSILGVVLIAVLRSGVSAFAIQKTVSCWGDMLLPPILIGVGLFMLFGHKLKLPQFGFSGHRDLTFLRNGSWGSLCLGMLFALAFCPTSGVFYFGMLIPMAAVENGGFMLPVVFAFATGLPVIVVAWILAYSVTSIGTFYNCMQIVQKWFRIVVAIVFISIGIYYGFQIYG